MSLGVTQLFFSDVSRVVRHAKAILSVLGTDPNLVAEFRIQTYAIGKAIMQENGWTDKKLAAVFSKISANNVVLGETSTAKLDELGAWLAEHGRLSLYA